MYGEASGDNREPSMFRSKYAEATTPTEVELVFSYAGKTYTVKRNPEYERPKSRGEGFTTQKAEVQLKYPDGRVVTKQRDVDNAIRDIMGINRSQFLQIAMIAQGDFLKLLLAPTEERKKIFRQIFKTQLYQDLQDRLKKESGQLNDKCDAARNSIKQYIDGITCDENDVLSIEVEKAKNGLLPAKDVMDLIDRLLTQDNDKKTAIQKSISDADKALEIVNANLGKIEAKEQTQKALDQAQKNLIGENETNLALKAAFDIEKGKVSEREQLAEEKAKIEAEFSRYEALDALEKQIKYDEDTISKNERQLKKDREQYAIDEAEFKILKKEFESLSDAGEGKEIQSNTKEYLAITFESVLRGEANSEDQSYTSLVEKYDILKSMPEHMQDISYRPFSDDIESFIAILENANEIIENKYTLSSFSEEFKKKFKDIQAFIEAGLQLSDGESCPFCGQKYNRDAFALIDDYNSFLQDEESKIIKAINGIIAKITAFSANLLTSSRFAKDSSNEYDKVKEYFPSFCETYISCVDVAITQQVLDKICEALETKKHMISQKGASIKPDIDIIKAELSNYKRVEIENIGKVKELNSNKNNISAERLRLRKALCNARFNQLIVESEKTRSDIVTVRESINDLTKAISEKENKVRIDKRKKLIEKLKDYLAIFFKDMLIDSCRMVVDFIASKYPGQIEEVKRLSA